MNNLDIRNLDKAKVLVALANCREPGADPFEPFNGGLTLDEAERALAASSEFGMRPIINVGEEHLSGKFAGAWTDLVGLAYDCERIAFDSAHVTTGTIHSKLLAVWREPPGVTVPVTELPKDSSLYLNDGHIDLSGEFFDASDYDKHFEKDAAALALASLINLVDIRNLDKAKVLVALANRREPGADPFVSFDGGLTLVDAEKALKASSEFAIRPIIDVGEEARSNGKGGKFTDLIGLTLDCEHTTSHRDAPEIAPGARISISTGDPKLLAVWRVPSGLTVPMNELPDQFSPYVNDGHVDLSEDFFDAKDYDKHFGKGAAVLAIASLRK